MLSDIKKLLFPEASSTGEEPPFVGPLVCRERPGRTKTLLTTVHLCRGSVANEPPSDRLLATVGGVSPVSTPGVWTGPVGQNHLPVWVGEQSQRRRAADLLAVD